MLKRTAALAGLAFLLSFSGSSWSGGGEREIPFPAWVFGHVVWEDESTTQSVYELVKGYQDNRIPVDAVIIDSPWETAYNTFDFDPGRYPEVSKLFSDLHRQQIKIVLWITSMVNTEDPEYQTCLNNGYFVKGMEARRWWKGVGGLIDYDNPQALAWWHARMNKALDLGIDAWKVDGTDPLMLYRGWKARQDYADKYYSDFYDYSRRHTSQKIVIMARPMEQGINESTFLLPAAANPLGLGVWLRFAPVDKNFMGWVGDQDPTFDGLAIARRHILRSARENYLILGSDIGGYRGPGPAKEVFLRWAQFGALCPLMENGGMGEHRPWKFDAETVRIYRAYVLLHKALLPYLYSTAVEKFQARKSMITPLPAGVDEYLLGDDLLVAPVTRPGGRVKVFLPPESDWMPFFADTLGKDADHCRLEGSRVPLLRGGCVFAHTYGPAEFPVFIRAGAALPWQTSPGAELLPGLPPRPPADRLLLVAPPAGADRLTINLTVYEEGKPPASLQAEIKLEGEPAVVTADGEQWPVYIPGPDFPRLAR